MVSSSLNVLLKLTKTSSPQKLFDYDCVTLYIVSSNLLSCIHLFWRTWTNILLCISWKEREFIIFIIDHLIKYAYIFKFWRTLDTYFKTEVTTLMFFLSKQLIS